MLEFLLGFLGLRLEYQTFALEGVNFLLEHVLLGLNDIFETLSISQRKANALLLLKLIITHAGVHLIFTFVQPLLQIDYLLLQLLHKLVELIYLLLLLRNLVGQGILLLVLLLNNPLNFLLLNRLVVLQFVEYFLALLAQLLNFLHHLLLPLPENLHLQLPFIVFNRQIVEFLLPVRQLLNQNLVLLLQFVVLPVIALGLVFQLMVFNSFSVDGFSEHYQLLTNICVLLLQQLLVGRNMLEF